MLRQSFVFWVEVNYQISKASILNCVKLMGNPRLCFSTAYTYKILEGMLALGSS